MNPHPCPPSCTCKGQDQPRPRRIPFHLRPAPTTHDTLPDFLVWPN